jgi:hypothetical protein
MYDGMWLGFMVPFFNPRVSNLIDVVVFAAPLVGKKRKAVGSVSL